VPYAALYAAPEVSGWLGVETWTLFWIITPASLE
jgi:hypothetical protein